MLVPNDLKVVIQDYIARNHQGSQSDLLYAQIEQAVLPVIKKVLEPQEGSQSQISAGQSAPYHDVVTEFLSTYSINANFCSYSSGCYPSTRNEFYEISVRSGMYG